MKLPNKASSFKESILYEALKILNYLDLNSIEEISVIELREKLKNKIKIISFIEALKLLNILEIITENGGILSVNRNKK